MEIRPFSKRPLTVGAFRFDADQARDLWASARYPFEFDVALTGGGTGTTVVRFRKDVGWWFVWNPGRGPAGDWQEVRHGDYVILAPTGCRYPVQDDQFERNYAEVGRSTERASEAA